MAANTLIQLTLRVCSSFCILPLGFTNAPADFQALINYAIFGVSLFRPHPNSLKSHQDPDSHIPQRLLERCLFGQMWISCGHHLFLGFIYFIHLMNLNAEGQCSSGLAPTCFRKAGTVIPRLCQLLTRGSFRILAHWPPPAHCPHEGSRPQLQCWCTRTLLCPSWWRWMPPTLE